MKTTLEASGEDVKLHSKRVEKRWNYTRSECIFSSNVGQSMRFNAGNIPKSTRWTTLETSGEDVKIHSQRVEKMWNLHSKRVEKMWKLHSKRVEKMWNYTRSECIFSSNVGQPMRFNAGNIPKSTRWTTLETSGEDVKRHSKRVEKIWNYTRNECIFSSNVRQPMRFNTGKSTR